MATEMQTAAVIVAHPDDETLWAGGTMLQRPQWQWWVASLCRADDPNRAPRFFNVLQQLGAAGAMDHLDDGPEQQPLPPETVTAAILQLLPDQHFNVVLTHHPHGEYTRHRRHEETGRAVIQLWHDGRIRADELWLFAYNDGGRAYYPMAVRDATIYNELPHNIWQMKFTLITELYGFRSDSWEAQTTPAAEAFWRFTDRRAALEWLYENTGV